MTSDKTLSTAPLSAQDIAQRIQLLRGQRVVLDSDFLFQLTADEKSEVVANCDHLKRLKFSSTLPHAFTEHGAIQAANVLASSQAVEMGIYVVRAFVQIRQAAALHADVDKRLRELELKHDSLSSQTQVELRQTRRDLKDVFDTLRELMTPPSAPPKRQIGFITDDVSLKKTKSKTP